jgi:CLIP-associating protein 1/2
MSSVSNAEDFTLVVPFTKAPDDDEIYAPPTHRTPRMMKHMSVDSGIPTYDDDSNFTMVNIPNLRSQPFGDRPSSSGSQPRQSTPRLSPIKSAASSPLQLQRLRSPAARSPERAKSPLVRMNNEAEEEPVQVYEDPFVGEETLLHGSDADNEKPVLEELPVNGRANERQLSEEPSIVDDLGRSTRSDEQNVDVQRTTRHLKTGSTGSVMARNEDINGAAMQPATSETLRSRKLLASGIERIRAKTLDVHGFRRVQDLVKGNHDIWGNDGQKFGDLLIALLDYLEASNDSLKVGGIGGTSAATKAQNLKTQVLTTIRAMLTVHRKEAAPYYSRALCSVLTARRQFEESMHIASDMEKTAEDIVKYGQPQDSLNAVLDLLESLSPTPSSPTSTSANSEATNARSLALEPGSSTSRTIVMSLSILGSLLAAAQSRNVSVSQSQNQRLGHVAVRFLQDTDSDVRRSDLEFCLVLYDRLGGEKGEGFWKAVGRVKEGHMNLITYYLARKGKTV